MPIVLQHHLAPLAVIYTGGTLGCHGQPLRPLGGPELLPAIQQVLGQEALEWSWLAWDTPLDSSQLEPAHWAVLLEQIIEFYRQGIRHLLIIHGTDTLAYSGAFLAEALAGSDLHVVLTGSQRPLLQSDLTLDPSSDAADNLKQALQALFHARAGVQIAFAGESWPAQTVQKIHSRDLAAFSGHWRAGYPAVSYLPLSTRTRQHWLDNWEHHWPSARARLLDTCLLTHHWTPQPLAQGLATLRDLLTRRPQALILLGYGLGNMPDHPELRLLARQAHQQGTLVVNATQVPFGGTDSRYAVSGWLATAQVLPSARLSFPALYARLYWLCARHEQPAQRRRRWSTLLNDTRSTLRDLRHER